MKTFKQLTKKFNYVNSNIESNFTLVDRKTSAYKLFHFNKSISSEDAVKEIEENGYVPANLFELLTWPDWNEKDLVVALGSSCMLYGDRDVPFLDVFDSKRDLDLSWWDGGWIGSCRFLAVRNSVSETSESALSSFETLTLEKAIKICKDAGLVVYQPK